MHESNQTQPPAGPPPEVIRWAARYYAAMGLPVTAIPALLLPPPIAARLAMAMRALAVR
jgi:hypothetical protein